MITITNTQDELTITGHAHSGTGPVTKDEVEACAAITALAHQLLGCLVLKEPEADDLRYERRKGYCRVQKSGLKRPDLIEYFMIGAELVQSGYPEFIQIIDPLD